MVDISEFDADTKKSLGSVEVTAEGGELQTGERSAPIVLASDWNSVLEGFGLDPAVFFIVDDTVRMSKWQQSKRLDNGDRDIIWLYSYRARFARKPYTATPLDVERLQKKIDRWKPRSTTTVKTDGDPSTFVICWADWQLGKSAGGGVEATVERIQASFSASALRIKQLRKQGRNIEKIAILNMGDPLEGCDGNYASQLFSVELNQRAQLNLALDLWTQGISALQPDIFASVLCNHGEWKRNGGAKSVTTDSDNSGGFLGDTIKRTFKDWKMEWHIAHDEMVQMVNLSGVEVGLTHGHKIVGKEFEWLRGQNQRFYSTVGKMPRLWVTAHVHHAAIEDFGPFWRIQCPSNDGGSKWFTDMTGKWSTSGTMTFLAGNHDPRGFSDAEVL